jgi:SAM-dependent methyltransferase
LLARALARAAPRLRAPLARAMAAAPAPAALLSREEASREDESPDAAFYAGPRFVKHLDAGAIFVLTAQLRELLSPYVDLRDVSGREGADVLDLCASWVSHLPLDVPLARVHGLGLNEAELAANGQLTEHLVHDLNADPSLRHLGDASFDAAVCACGLMYLTRPLEVARELRRVLRPRGVAVFSFSNRLFPSKATRAWLRGDDAAHCDFAVRLLRAAGFARVEALDLSPSARGVSDPLFVVQGFVPEAEGAEEGAAGGVVTAADGGEEER